MEASESTPLSISVGIASTAAAAMPFSSAWRLIDVSLLHALRAFSCAVVGQVTENDDVLQGALVEQGDLMSKTEPKMWLVRKFAIAARRRRRCCKVVLGRSPFFLFLLRTCAEIVVAVCVQKPVKDGIPEPTMEEFSDSNSVYCSKVDKGNKFESESRQHLQVSALLASLAFH
jgi:hypothetical protein